MKNQYFGDINDYLKYALLRALSGQGERQTVVAWMLTADDGGRDGRIQEYLNRPAKYRPLDPELFDFLAAADLGPQRGVRQIEESGLLPNTRFHSEPLGDGRAQRLEHFLRLTALYPGADWVFFDPDNGLEIPSCGYGRRNSSKYLFEGELSHAFGCGLSVLLYQHFPHEPRPAFIARLQARIAAVTGTAAMELLVTGRVGFFLAVQERHRVAFEAQIDRLIASDGTLLRRGSPDEARSKRESSAPRPIGRVPDLEGVISATGGLTAQDVARRKVLCPACLERVFTQWPLGWDGHSHRCAGLKAGTPEERKAEFKTRFRALFR